MIVWSFFFLIFFLAVGLAIILTPFVLAAAIQQARQAVEGDTPATARAQQQIPDNPIQNAVWICPDCIKVADKAGRCDQCGKKVVTLDEWRPGDDEEW